MAAPAFTRCWVSRTASIVLVKERIGVVERRFGDRQTDGVVFANHFGKPDRGVDGIELTIDIDFPQLADQDHSGVAILGGIPCRDRDRQPLVGPAAQSFHDGSGLLAVLLHVGIVTRQGLEDLARHSPDPFGGAAT